MADQASGLTPDGNQVLVAVASRHGSTREIAQVITNEMRRAGLKVDLRDADTVLYLDSYAAVILGSAVYMGNWLPEAREFVGRHGRRLKTQPLWLFSSGPIGDGDPRPHGEPARITDLIDSLAPRDHRVFVGKLDPHVLKLSERLAARVVQAPEGDFRDWDAIRAWARGIAAELKRFWWGNGTSIALS